MIGNMTEGACMNQGMTALILLAVFFLCWLCLIAWLAG
jgi:hypothetical protein